MSNVQYDGVDEFKTNDIPLPANFNNGLKFDLEQFQQLVKGNYDFDNGKLYINIKAIEKNVVQSVFGFNKDNIKSDGKYFVAVNLTMLIKLSKADLFSVKITASENNKTENENVDVATTEAVEGEFTESKNKQIMQSVITFLNYLDKNKAFNSLLEIENHIFTLDNYGHKKNGITENVRAQTKGSKNYDLYGSVAVEFNHSKDFKVNSIDQLENEFNKVFAIK